MENRIQEKMPSIGCLLALDWGQSRMGLAISDALQISANPLPFISVKDKSHDKQLDQLQKIILEREIKGIVLGLPIGLDGRLGSSATAVLAFAKKISKKINLPIAFEDESFSTSEAMEMLRDRGYSLKKTKSVKDSASAFCILETFLKKAAP